ncbi:MAG: hypothetical protein MPL62_13375 [Alphaproteobacteria bacterium]|nr:hypothetical protein [Alphaproteobacteria bacterium]
MINLDDRVELILTLRQYHTIIKGQVEMDQFIDGLNAYQLLDMMRAQPELMKPLLVSQQEIQLTKGICMCIIN